MNPTICIVNKSKVVSDADVKRVIPALQKQIARDFKPITYLFAKDDIAASGEYTTTLSHELLEMIADPGVNLYAIGKCRIGGRSRTGLFGLEVCDPVEANSYRIQGVKVSDWVVPEWFEMEHKRGQMKMDHLGVID